MPGPGSGAYARELLRTLPRCAACGRAIAIREQPVRQARLDGGTDHYHVICMARANRVEEWEKNHGLPTTPPDEQLTF